MRGFDASALDDARVYRRGPRRDSREMKLDELPDLGERLVIRRVDELRAHPSYVRLGLAVSASQLSALAELGGLAFREPIIISRHRIIIDGYARVELARLQSRPTLSCHEYELTEADALRWLLQRHRRSNGLNAFSRILLALELELDFQEKARSNQRAGGQNKGSSKLTEAQRLDVRSAISTVAGGSVGNVTKVKQLTTTAPPKILQALLRGEISIHRAWKWRTLGPEEQREHLRVYHIERGLKNKVRTLISKHRAETPQTSKRSSITIADLNQLAERLFAMSSSLTQESESIVISLIDAPGKVVFMTTELFHAVSAE